MTVIPLPDPRPPAVSISALLAPVTAVSQDPLPGLTEPPARVRGGVGIAPADLAEARLRCRLLLEALAGKRPLAQAEPYATLDVLRTLARGAKRRRRIAARSVRIAGPSPGVLEVALRVADLDAGREGAVALRLVRRRGVLVCTALELEPRTMPWAA